tara:strand:- start:162 stop:545 length:384 start_codon:yes stop_codon:yes gene_type:complete
MANMSVGLGQALQHRMNYLVQRQGAVSGNIANASTPGYLPRDVQFNSLVDQNRFELNRTHNNHIKGMGLNTRNLTYSHVQDMKANGNGVDVSAEMLKMSDIQLDYRMVTQLYSKHAAMHRMALGRNQ